MVYYVFMETLAKADIFFFVTAIAVVAISILIIAICVYILRILADTKNITSKVRKESDEILADVGAVRRIVERQGKRVGGIFGTRKKSSSRKKGE